MLGPSPRPSRAHALELEVHHGHHVPIRRGEADPPEATGALEHTARLALLVDHEAAGPHPVAEAELASQSPASFPKPSIKKSSTTRRIKGSGGTTSTPYIGARAR